MINLSIDENYIPDLQDDFLINRDLNLYQFIGNDPVRAFYLGCNITEWFKDLDREQAYLYSKQARHNRDNLECYKDQIEFWTKKFSNNEEEEINLIELFEYILNNMFWDNDDDIIKVAFFFGNLIYKNEKHS